MIEIHVSGGRASEPWMSGGRPCRLDSHDAAVPEPVWALLDRVLPRCPALRGVTLERLEGTVAPEDVDLLLGELARIRSAIARRGPPVAVEPRPPSRWPDEDLPELALAEIWSAGRPEDTLRELLAGPLPPVLRAGVERALAHPGGVALTRRLVARQRFERLVQGSAEASRWFEEDPAGFARAFRAYEERTPPTAFLPLDEAALFRRWQVAVGSGAPGEP